jgi:hypothetical protein
MPSPYLSKSDFKACSDCRTKLFYRKRGYATNLDENEYLKFLADGGFMIETVAKAQYPTGVDLVDERDPQFRENRRHLLLQYCQLDTAAMVMIWLHWIGQKS